MKGVKERKRGKRQGGAVLAIRATEPIAIRVLLTMRLIRAPSGHTSSCVWLRLARRACEGTRHGEGEGGRSLPIRLHGLPGDELRGRWSTSYDPIRILISCFHIS